MRPGGDTIRPKREAVLAALVLFGAAYSSEAFLYSSWQKAAGNQVRDGLSRVASAAAALVDTDLHASFTSSAQESSADYAHAIEPLRRLQRSDPSIAFVYTFVLRDGKVRFVLDPTPEGDADGDGLDDKSHIMEAYDHATPEMLESLVKHHASCDSEPNTDPWGSFVSAYAPLLTRSGEYVGSVGIDLKADSYLDELAWIRNAAIAGSALAMAFSLAVGLVVWRLRSRSARDAMALRLLVADLSIARDAAEESSRIKTEFLATISHEIRTPMNGVIGMNEMLLGSTLDASQRDMAETVQGSANALLTIVNDILDFSRLEAEQFQSHDADFNLLKLVGRVCAFVTPQARSKNLELVCLFEPQVLPCVRGDANSIRQVVHNLLMNAVKFTERGNVTIHVRIIHVEGAQPRLRCEVRDTGIGIAPAAIKSLFQSFSQVDGSYSRKYGGTGLGLAISKRLVELMDGEIGVSSEGPQGSTFWFELPILLALDAGSIKEFPLSATGHDPRSSLPMTQSKPVTTMVELPAMGTSVGLNVLVAEDSSVNQKVVLMMLAKLGCRTKAVWNGLEALDALETADYDLVLMDCQMPEMDGFAASTAIRTREAGRRHTRIVALTANAMPGDREKCLAAGMDDYLSKPVSKADLQRVLSGEIAAVAS